MGEFTIYVHRDVPITAANDKEAAAVAQRIHEAVDRVVGELAPGATCLYARSTCHRGRNNKMIFDQERDAYADD